MSSAESSNESQFQVFSTDGQIETANLDNEPENSSENQALWFNNGFQRRYACDRCRGHKLRCNRDPLASCSKPCQRCVKAKAECTISSSFRPGKSGNQKPEVSKRSLGRGPEGGESGKKRKGANIPSPHRGEWTPKHSTQRIPSLQQNASSSHIPTTSISPETPLLGQPEEQDGDILQFLSLPWTDFMNVDFDHEGDPEYSSISWQPFTSTNHVIENHDSSINSRPSDSTNPSNNNVYESPGRVEIAKDIRKTLESISSPLPSFTSEQFNSPTPTNRKEAFIRKLSDFSASLMKDLNRNIACKRACSFLFTPSDNATAEHLFRTVDSSLCQNNAIGRLFEGTEIFVQFLQEYESYSQAATTIERSSKFSDFPRPLVEWPTDPEKRMETRWSALESYVLSKQPGMIEQTSPVSDVSDSSLRSQSATIDILAITILNCYISLLKIFENIFLSYQYILQVPALSPIYAKLPPIIPGFHINGFQLKNHRNLSLKILIQVSREMLDSMERAMGFGKEIEGIYGNLGDPIFQNLLQMLLKRNDLSIPGDDFTGMKKIRDLLTAIESVLNTQKAV